MLTTAPAFKNDFVTTKKLDLRIQSFHYEADLEFPEHTHAESSIVICVSGMLESIQFGTRVLLHPGEVLITNRNTFHSSKYCINGEPSKGIAIDVGPQASQQLAGMDSSLAPFHLSTARFAGTVPVPRAHALANDLQRELSLSQAGKDIMVESLAIQICTEVLRSWPTGLISHHDGHQSNPLPRWQFIRTIESMYSHSLANFDWVSVAQSLDRPPRELETEFFHATNKWPEEFFRLILAQRAERLLARGQSAQMVARKLGFREGRQVRQLLRKYK
jgi:hypothetical protein